MKSKSLLNHPLITDRYFFPMEMPFNDPYWVNANNTKLACYYHEIDPNAKTIVYFHGNGEIVADYVPDFPELLGKLGVNCFLAEFRGYGISEGKPFLGDLLDDVKAIIAAVPTSPENMIIFGRSVGSIFALEAISKYPNIAGLILESSIADPLERLLMRIQPEEIGVTPAELNATIDAHLNHQQKISNYSGPTLLMHTRHDGLVDVSHAEKLHKWARNSKLAIFDKGDHNSIMYMNHQAYFNKIDQFLTSLEPDV